MRLICLQREDHGEAPISYADVIRGKDQPLREVARDAFTRTISFSDATDLCFFTRMSIAAPNEIWRLDVREELDQRRTLGESRT